MGIFTSQHSSVEKMARAKTYKIWKAAAQEHDVHTGLDDWKSAEASQYYDYRSIRKRLDELRDLMKRNDLRGLLFKLNEGIHGNQGGIGNPALYTKSRFGTKRLINEYIAELTEALDILAEADNKLISEDEKQDFFSRASRCYGRSALMLSGGAALGHFHMGVVKAMVEEDLLPEIISGSSAGSLIAAVLCTHCDEDLDEVMSIENIRGEIAKEKSWRPKGFIHLHPNSIDERHLRNDVVGRLIPDMTFQEAYELTGRKLNITVTGAKRQQASRLLNAVTSPNVLIRSAVMASCAVAGIYPPVTLKARDVDGQEVSYLPESRWIDGSFSDDLPAKRLSRLYGVNHYIVSMVNPAVIPFQSNPDERSHVLTELVRIPISLSRQGLSRVLKISHRYMPWRDSSIGTLQHLLYGVLSQDYVGDINIMPSKRFFNPLTLLNQKEPAEIMRFIEDGEHQTWEKLEMIRNCTAISRKLDHIIHTKGWTINH
ncbi:MAG: DUF3336 domain-containing protein [Cellvibrionaceae bacterium]|nr:DUF3336 domain-containing protein [Cellvibrionaceae bacterium]